MVKQFLLFKGVQNIKQHLISGVCLLGLTVSMHAGAASEALDSQSSVLLQKTLQSKHRTPAFVKRDQYRHPFETLSFFDVQAQHAVVEIWPGGGWYAEILAPYLKDKGLYYSAGFSTSAKKSPEWRKKMAKQLHDKFTANPEVYAKAKMTALSIPEDAEIAPESSVDRVLTFRNVHNWMKGEYAPDVFQSMFNALKPEGILGVVEHRAAPGTSLEEMVKSGYVTEAYVIKLATDAGFKLLEKSEVNANVKDTKQHPKGVWTLPPSLRLKDQNREAYIEIGESDRMTLKFIKPKP